MFSYYFGGGGGGMGGLLNNEGLIKIIVKQVKYQK